MNIALLRWLYGAIADRTVPVNRHPLPNLEAKLDFILFVLKELTAALATDGSQQSIDDFHQERGDDFVDDMETR